jgi:hypothetical protein
MKKILLYTFGLAVLATATSCTQIVKPDSGRTIMGNVYSQVDEEEEEKTGTKLIPRIRICKKLQVVFSKPQASQE